MFSRPTLSLVLSVAVAASVSLTAADAAQAARQELDPAGIARLQADSGGTAVISTSPATGAARFIRMAPGSLRTQGQGPEEQARSFFDNYGSALGIKDSRTELITRQVKTDTAGFSHVDFDQVYQGVPVFAGRVKAHFDRNGLLYSVNGNFVPNIDLATTPLLSVERAKQLAVAELYRQLPLETSLDAGDAKLMVYRTNLARGIPGQTHLAYEVEVTNGLTAREMLYIDAHSGKKVDQITGIYNHHEDLDRNVYEVPADWDEIGDPPAEDLIWSEGDFLPYGNVDVDNIINFTAETYEFFANISGGAYRSWDGDADPMDTILLPEDHVFGCPNAFAALGDSHFCPGVTSDDVVSHEWAHNYTGATHNLIYQWQPGALNEAYSDIFGEVVDLLNGPSQPDAPRSEDGGCSLYSVPGPIAMAPGAVGAQVTIPASMIDKFDGQTLKDSLPGVEGSILPDRVEVTAPAGVAGEYRAVDATFGGEITETGTTGMFVLVDDGTDVTSDGCEAPFNNEADVRGKIALIDRGSCEFGVKSLNAEEAGAIGVIVMNNQPDDLSIFVDDSFRWLVGQESESFGGAIRDMWNPGCYTDPTAVTDENYWCTSGDSGGVHINSGIPNHAFALLVDGGTFNDVSVEPIGMTKAVALYWRAMTEYQVETSDFFDHADALEQSCQDLKGLDVLYEVKLGDNPTHSDEIITQADCDAVAAAISAVDLRADNACEFETLLESPAPALCGSGRVLSRLFEDDFEAGQGDWVLSNEGVFAEYTPLDWELTSNLPDRDGSAFFALNDINRGDCVPGSDDQSGAMYLDSPVITIPAEGVDVLAVAFEHLIASEVDFDGGNVWVSVNGGEFFLVGAQFFDFNPYNDMLIEDTGPPIPVPNTNPLAGQDAFVGADEGSVSGTWGQSQISFSDFSFEPGDTVQIRFAFGADGCNGLLGWFVDDFEMYECESIGIEVDIAGSCPGALDFSVSGGTPNSQHVVLGANGEGTGSIPDGVLCGGTEIGLDNESVRVLLSADANENGEVSFTVNAPANRCATAFQIVDLTSCSVSDVIPTP